MASAVLHDVQAVHNFVKTPSVLCASPVEVSSLHAVDQVRTPSVRKHSKVSLEQHVPVQVVPSSILECLCTGNIYALGHDCLLPNGGTVVGQRTEKVAQWWLKAQKRWHRGD